MKLWNHWIPDSQLSEISNPWQWESKSQGSFYSWQPLPDSNLEPLLHDGRSLWWQDCLRWWKCRLRSLDWRKSTYFALDDEIDWFYLLLKSHFLVLFPTESDQLVDDEDGWSDDGNAWCDAHSDDTGPLHQLCCHWSFLMQGVWRVR